jgi:predicted Zn-dependent peptidase
VSRGKSTPVVQHRETEQLQLAIAFHTPGRHHPGRHALRLLSILLGESTSSRLFQQLREDRGLCYHISSDIALFDDTGSLDISAGLDPESREEALKAIHHELKQLVTEGPSDEELERAKKIAVTANKIALESTAAQMAWVAESLLFEGAIITPAESRARLMPVTPEDVQKMAVQIFSPANQAIAEIRSL